VVSKSQSYDPFPFLFMLKILVTVFLASPLNYLQKIQLLQLELQPFVGPLECDLD